MKLKEITITKEELAEYLSIKNGTSVYDNHDMLDDLFEWKPQEDEKVLLISWHGYAEFSIFERSWSNCDSSNKCLKEGRIFPMTNRAEAQKKCDKINKAFKEILQNENN